MCTGNDCLIYYFFVTIVAFAVLIYFLLKDRKSTKKEFLKTTADQVWAGVAKKAESLNLSKSNLLFGIWQDASLTTVSLVVKDSKDQIVGQVFKPMGIREQTIKIGNQVFLIEFPLTWKRTAILHAPNGAGIIAKYIKTSWYGRHNYDLIKHGVLTSEWPGLNLTSSFNYKLNDKVIGTYQNISSRNQMGRLLIFPHDIPLEIQIFILSV